MMRILPRLVMLLLMLIAAVAGWLGRRTGKRSPGSAQPAQPPATLADPQTDIRHRDWRIRVQAVHALADSPDADAIALLTAALADPDSDVREAAIQALSTSGDDALPGVIGQLEQGNMDSRQAAAQTLGLIGSRGAVPALIAALGDESHWVRGPAARSLGLIGDESAVQPLIAALEDPEPAVQATARDSLRQIGTREALQAIAHES